MLAAWIPDLVQTQVPVRVKKELRIVVVRSHLHHIETRLEWECLLTPRDQLVSDGLDQVELPLTVGDDKEVALLSPRVEQIHGDLAREHPLLVASLVASSTPSGCRCIGLLRLLYHGLNGLVLASSRHIFLSVCDCFTGLSASTP